MWQLGLKTHSILWVENVRGGWIVNNDDVAELSSQPAEVFDIVSSVKNAGFSKKSCSEHTPLVQQVCHRVCILSKPIKHTNMLQWDENKYKTSLISLLYNYKSDCMLNTHCDATLFLGQMPQLQH